MTEELQISPNSVTVQIPDHLVDVALMETVRCGKYITKREEGNNTHPLMKALGLYLLLKAEAPESGWILNYTKQIPALAISFAISQRSFYTYLKQLEKLKIAFREGTRIRVVSWSELGKVFNINTKKRTQIKFTYDGKQKIHWWLAAIEVKQNQELQQYMIWKKVNKHSDKDSLISALIKRGFDTTKWNNPEYFSSRLFMLYVEDFHTGTEVHNILVNIRSDTNRGIKALSKAWGISEQSVSYWKKQMQRQQIINIEKVTITSQYSYATKECHKNPFCHVLWDDKLKERVWFLCDQISVIFPGQWEEFLKISQAA